jgi:outer membrane protein TolC
MPRSHHARARAAAGALALALTGAPLAAQQPLTLQEGIALAQRHSHQARAARATHDAARYRSRAFQARLLPQLSVTGTLPEYNRSIIPVLQPDGSTLFRPQQQTTASLAMRLSQTLPVTGGDLFVTSSLTRLDLSGEQSGRTWSSAPFAIGLRQDILRPNSAGWNRREQAAQAESDERAYLQAMEDVALQTTDRFFAAYAARLALDNAVANVAVNDTLYRLNTGRFQVGRIGENDLLQNQLAVLRSRTALEGARLDHEHALAALRLALGLPPDQPLEVVVSDTVPALDPDTARAVAEALRNAAAVSTVALQDVQAQRRVTEARLADGVGATVQASYGFNATAPGMGMAYQNLLEARQLSVAVQVPLWQWGAHGDAVRAAEADRRRVADLAASTLDQLALDARFAALELSQARRTVALQVTADSVAEKRYQVAYNRYVIGRITIDNLFIAQAEKDQALVQFVAGLRGYWLAYYQLRRITLFDFETGRPLR